MAAKAVAVDMGNRTAEQCLHHYRDNLASFKKGDWSPEEDAALLQVRARALRKQILCAVAERLQDRASELHALPHAAMQSALQRGTKACTRLPSTFVCERTQQSLLK